MRLVAAITASVAMYIATGYGEPIVFGCGWFLTIAALRPKE